MMSLLVALFLMYKLRSKVVFVLLLLLEIFIVFEIIYLGTHTSNDMVVGFAFGLTWFAVYVAIERVFKSTRPNFEEGARRRFPIKLLLWGLVLLACVLVLEVQEERLDQATTHPEEWQKTYERYCRLKEVGALCRISLNLLRHFFLTTPSPFLLLFSSYARGHRERESKR